ncbi:MAG: hypothetical protein ACYCY3_07795 [Halothiobacillus sp.]
MSIPSTRLIRVLDRQVEAYGLTESIRMDNGSEMRSHASTARVGQRGVELRYIQPG